MIILLLNWNTILENSVSGLVGLIIGLILARKGYEIWKEQFFYQKRVEVYAEFLPYLFKLRSYIEKGVEKKFTVGLTASINEELELYTLPLAQKFGIYFNQSYLTDICDLINLYNKIKDDENDINKEELKKYVDERFFRIYLLRNQIISQKDQISTVELSPELLTHIEHSHP